MRLKHNFIALVVFSLVLGTFGNSNAKIAQKQSTQDAITLLSCLSELAALYHMDSTDAQTIKIMSAVCAAATSANGASNIVAAHKRPLWFKVILAALPTYFLTKEYKKISNADAIAARNKVGGNALQKGKHNLLALTSLFSCMYLASAAKSARIGRLISQIGLLITQYKRYETELS